MVSENFNKFFNSQKGQEMILKMDEPQKTATASLDPIIESMNADGSFPVSALGLCGFNPDEVIGLIPDATGATCGADKLQILWTTVVIVEMIRKRFPEQEIEWKLLVAKSERYLRNNLGASLASSWKEAAVKFIASH